PHLLEIELFADARADRGDERADLLVLQHLVHSGFLDVQDLPAQRKDRLELPAASLFRRPSRRRPFHDEQLALCGIPLLAVRQLPRQVEPLEEALPSRQLPRLPGGLSGLGREDGLPDADLRDLRGLVEEVREFLVHDRLDDPFDLRVSELHLRLTFEKRIGSECRGDFARLIHFTYSAMPPSNWNTSPRPWILSTMMIRRLALRNASSRSRAASVSYSNSMVSKTSGSGRNVMIVPVP